MYYGNTKITQHGLKVSGSSECYAGHYTEEEEADEERKNEEKEEEKEEEEEN